MGPFSTNSKMAYPISCDEHVDCLVGKGYAARIDDNREEGVRPMVLGLA